MNQRAIQLYQQAAAFAYQTAGADAGRGTIVESLTAGKFAELIIRECAEFARQHNLEKADRSHMIHKAIKEHFGVES
jgi:hypothetical protein